MSITTLYQTSARAVGGRDGRSTTDDGVLDVKLTTPKALGGPGGDGTNPEQLFAAGYAACFLNAMKYIAHQNKSVFPADTSVTAHVAIGPRSEGEGFGLDVTLVVTMPGVDHADAESLTDAAHKVCPYSNAIRNNVDVKLKVE